MGENVSTKKREITEKIKEELIDKPKGPIQFKIQ